MGLGKKMLLAKFIVVGGERRLVFAGVLFLAAVFLLAV